MPPTVSSLDVSAASSLKAERIAEVIERLQAGDAVDVEALCADCPELREELQMLLPTLAAIADLEQSLSGEKGDGGGVFSLTDF